MSFAPVVLKGLGEVGNVDEVAACSAIFVHRCAGYGRYEGLTGHGSLQLQSALPETALSRHQHHLVGPLIVCVAPEA